MDKRQGMLAAVLGLAIVAGLAFWWTTQEQEVSNIQSPVIVAAPNAPMNATVTAPLTGTPESPAAQGTPESDAVALSEEVIDQVRKEGEELGARAGELEAQAKDGAALIALKEKQIRELEAQLKTMEPSSQAKH